WLFREQPFSLVESAVGVDGQDHAEKTQHAVSFRTVDRSALKDVGSLRGRTQMRPGRPHGLEDNGPRPDQEQGPPSLKRARGGAATRVLWCLSFTIVR